MQIKRLTKVIASYCLSLPKHSKGPPVAYHLQFLAKDPLKKGTGNPKIYYGSIFLIPR